MASTRAMRFLGYGAALAAGPFLQGCLNQDHPGLRTAHNQCEDIENTPSLSAEQHYTIGPLSNITDAGDLPEAAVLQELLNGMINSSVLTGILDQLPNQMNFSLGGRTSGGTSFAGCDVGYTVGATLNQCSGMNNIEMTTHAGTIGENQAGDVIATVPMVISAGPVSCSGSACAHGSVCGAVAKTAASVAPSLSINHATVEVAMKVVPGSGANEGKHCFQAEGVAINGANFVWGNLEVNFNGLAFDVPSSALQQVWENLQLPQVEGIFNEQLGQLLQDQLASMNTCF